MARTPKAKSAIEEATSLLSETTKIGVRLDIVKTLVVIPSFMELELPIQLSIMDTLVKYVLTGERA
jgi:hypothetical protein